MEYYWIYGFRRKLRNGKNQDGSMPLTAGVLGLYDSGQSYINVV